MQLPYSDPNIFFKMKRSYILLVVLLFMLILSTAMYIYPESA